MTGDDREYTFHVLFAGDDAELFAEAGGVLGALRGARVELVQQVDCAGALNVLAEHHFDICLVGETLHDGSGIDLIRAASAEQCKTSLIYIAESACCSRSAEAMESGAVDYLVKGEMTVSLMERSLRYVVERRNLQEELGMLLEAAGESEKVKAEFMAKITHEVKTPLNAIIGMIDLVLDSDLTHIQHENLMLARFSADSLHNLLRSLLDLSSMEEGKAVLRNRTFSLREVLHRAVVPLQMAAGRKAICLKSCIDDSVPDLLYGDPERLTQVLHHLVGNAVKFTDSGEISVAVEAEPGDCGTMLQWIVRDTGPGIPKDRIDQMFQLFTQMDESYSRKHSGVGIGLSIVRHVVTLLGGRIWVESERGRGTTFHFTTLFSIAGEKPAWPQPLHRSRPGAASAGTVKPKVLVAEDSMVQQLIVTEMLQRLGYQVTVVNNGQEAVAAVGREDYSVLFLDLRMPEMDGCDAARLIREREKVSGCRVPMIAMSARRSLQDQELCLQAGMDGYLGKPLVEQDMLSLLDALVHPAGGPADTGGCSPVHSFRGLDNRDIFNGNSALFQEVMIHFLHEGPSLLDSMKQGFSKGDGLLIEQSAHKLKGMAASVGASALADGAFRILLELRKGNLERPDALLESLEQMMSGLAKEMKQWTAKFQCIS